MDFLKGCTAGYIQEEIVYLAVSSLPNLRTISNIKLYSFKMKKETEIDLIIISSSCIYCVEIKSYKSRLEGKFNERTWIGRTGRYTKNIYNPVFQNAEHIRTLRNNLRRNNLPVYNIQNIIVVPNSCSIVSDCDNIYKIGELIRLLEDSCKIDIPLYNIDKVHETIKDLEVF